MSADESDEGLKQAIIQSVELGAYPESDDVVSAQLPASVLPALLSDLQKTRDQVKDEIRQLSKDAAPDVDGWIAQAKKLQADIERSKATAREIVAQAQAGKKLEQDAHEASNKAGLLEKEVAFNSSLVETLERIRTACAILSQAQDAVVHGDIRAALSRQDEANQVIADLVTVENTRAYTLLCSRSRDLKAALAERTLAYARSLVSISVVDHQVTISMQSQDIPAINLPAVVDTLTSLDALAPYLKHLKRELGVAILDTRLSARDQNATIVVNDNVVSASKSGGASGVTAALDDVLKFVSYLTTHLPSSIYQPLSGIMMPDLTTRLVEEWLDPCVPTDIDEMPYFQQILDQVSKLADKIDGFEWSGSAPLREWVQSAPRTWLNKRREIALGAVRSLLFTGLRDRKTVERVETQMVSKGDVIMSGTQDDDAWDEAWEEEEEQKLPAASKPQASSGDNDDDDASAWGLEEEEAEAPSVQAADPGTEADDDGTEAWGWDDEESGGAPESRQAPKEQTRQRTNGASSADQATEREITLKETYTVTAVPDGILEIIVKVVSDAESLTKPSYAQTPIGPAASALYTLPTFALAMYRAAASTAYGKLETGNMLIYNDSTRLAEQLRAFVDQQTAKDASSDVAPNMRPSARLRLDNDLKALDSFAKRAYSAEMESQRTIIRDMLDGAQGFSNCMSPPFADACESAVTITAERLRTVHGQWTPILSRAALLQSLGSLLSTATSKMMLEIEDLPDIGAEESRGLRELCDKLSAVKDLFSQEHGGGAGHGDMTGIYCPNWFKFQYLAEILESSLADIKYLWVEGELRLEFEAEEVTELIEALFADSEYRRKAILDIRRE
ncbi:hypothetical protein MBLNU459_g0429t1 [Dothideomycetes sp. NU459]